MEHAVADEAFERAFKLVDQRAEGGVILSQDGHDFFGLGGLRERGEAAQIAEDHRHFAAVAFQRLQSR